MFRVLVIFLITIYAFTCYGASPKNFRETKRAARIIWADHRICQYTGCHFDKQLQVDLKSCTYHPKDLKRAQRIEWEHIVPVSWFGRQRPCWREPLCKNKKGKKFSGRHCCEFIDPEFREMYMDLHNLIPVIGEVNAARKSYRFGEFYPEGKLRFQFNGSQMLISEHYKIAEPRDEVKGLVARAYLYMAHAYPFKLSNKQKEMFERWDKTYPPSEWEIQWNEKVKTIQLKDNPFISQYTDKSERSLPKAA